MTALFTPAGDGRFTPSDATRGPWDPRAQHGGAPAALLGALVERAEPGADMRVARLTLELVRPVPLDELRSEVEVVRPGKRVQLIEARLFAGEDLVVRAVALRLRRGEPTEGAAAPEPADVPGPEGAEPARLAHLDPDEPFFGSHGVDLRFVRGSWTTPGPAFTWIALREPVVEGVEPTGLQRAMAAADFGNGVSALLDWGRFAFINPDLSVHLERDPEGEWIGLDAQTRIGPDGTALAESVLYDARGRVGRAVQTLLVQPLS